MPGGVTMPSNYISELAALAYEKISPEDWEQSEEIQSEFHDHKPATEGQLEQELRRWPRLQARIAWHLGYTPSMWLLKGELDLVQKRRATVGMDPIDPAGEPYERAAKSGLMG